MNRKNKTIVIIIVVLILASGLIVWQCLKRPLPEISEMKVAIKEVKIVINYNFIAHIPPERSLSEAASLIADLNADMIFRAFNDRSGLIPESPETAFDEFSKCYNTSIAKSLAKMHSNLGMTYSNLRDEISAVKAKNPNILFSVTLHPQYVYKITIDPMNGKCIDTRNWALNFANWNLINPETGKVFTLEESQKVMNKITGGTESELETMYYPDITNEDYQDYLLKKVEKYLDLNVDVIDFDVLYAQTQASLNIVKWMKSKGYYEGDVYQHRQ